MSARSWVNGLAATSVPALDRGLHYGDGVFTTALVVDGRVVYLDEHIQRLMRDAQALKLPPVSPWLLRSEFETAAADQALAVVKYLLTRGVAERGYRAPARGEATRIVLRAVCPSYPRSYWGQGIALRVCAHRLSAQPHLAGVKHLNRLDQVLARSEWSGEDRAEGLLLGQNSELVCGTMTNVFFVSQGRLLTPSLETAGVNGVMRALILQAAEKLAIPIGVGRYTLENLLAADEVFMSNAVIGLWPVAACGKRRWSRCPGPLATQLSAVLRHPFTGVSG
ncbi:MAG: aminodeoxychorismate lyase [Nevskiales bacterium]